MMNSNTLSPEASSTNQQGLLGNGKKGKSATGESKTLFSSLLEALQKGKSGIEKKGDAKLAAKQVATDIEGKVQGEKTQPATPQIAKTKSIVTKHPLLKEGELTTTSLKTPSVKNNNTDVLAAIQEPTLTPQQTILAKATGDKSEQGDVLVLSKKQNKTLPQTSTQQTDQPNQHGKEQLNQPAHKGSGIVLPEQQPLQKASNSEVPSPPTGFDANAKQTDKVVSKPLLNVPQNTKANNTAEGELQQASQKTTTAQASLRASAVEVDKLRTEKTMEAGLQRNVPQTNEQKIAQANVHINVKDEGELKDSLKSGQSPAATLLQRTPVQNAAQHNNITVNQQNNGINARMTEGGNTSSQQDMGANQQDIDMAMMDANKADSRATKTLDFQAQLAYKSQRAFTPGDTMMEIVRSAKTGNTSLELQLEPANLGKVQISIQMDAAKQIQVAFTVDQAASRHALEQQMPQLRLALAQQGLDLGGFSMQMNQQGGQQDHASSAHGTTSGTGANAPTIAVNEDQTTRIGVNIATDGRLNILA